MLTQYSTNSCDYSEVEKKKTKTGLECNGLQSWDSDCVPRTAESASPGNFINANS